MIEVPPARGRIGSVLAISSIFLVSPFMTSATGHVPDVADILINSRIRNMVRKNRIKLTKIVCHVSVIFSALVVSKGSFPRTLLSVTFIVLISLSANVEAQLVILMVTPLISLGNVPCMIFCMLTTKMRIIENPATKITGLKIRSSITLKLRYFPIHQLPHHSIALSLKKSIESTISGDAITKIRRNATLMMFAIKRSANPKV